MQFFYINNFSTLTIENLPVSGTFSIIGIFEIRWQDSSHTVDIEGYNFVHNYRPDRSGGGVGLYLTTELEYKLCNDLGFPGQTCVE